MLGGLSALVASVVPRPRVARALALACARFVVYTGAACAVQRGGWHQERWQLHRRAVAALLRVAPAISSGTIVVMTGVPEDRDPFTHAYWLDLTMRLAYPGTPVSGVYFLADGRPAPGNSLRVANGRWEWDGIVSVNLRTFTIPWFAMTEEFPYARGVLRFLSGDFRQRFFDIPGSG